MEVDHQRLPTYPLPRRCICFRFSIRSLERVSSRVSRVRIDPNALQDRSDSGIACAASHHGSHVPGLPPEQSVLAVSGRELRFLSGNAKQTNSTLHNYSATRKARASKDTAYR